MATALSYPTISGVTTPPYLSALTETANIQNTINFLYYGSTDSGTTPRTSLSTSSGIYGMLSQLQTQITGLQTGINVHESAKWATTTTLAAVYAAGTADASNGTGIGATITFSATGVQKIDSATINIALNERVLVKDGTTALPGTTSVANGIYYVSTLPAIGVAGILTRALDSDNSVAGEMSEGDFLYVADGDSNYNEAFMLTTSSATGTNPSGGQGAIRIGTDPVTFTQFIGVGSYYIGSTQAAITTAPATGSPLAGLSTIGIQGGTSGTITLNTVAVAGTNTITLPALTGTIAINPTTTIGDIIYASATGTPGTLSRLSGNTATQTSFLASTGNGTANTTTSFISSTGTAGTNVVLATSPTFATSILGGTSMDVFHTLTTGTLNIGGAATAITIGNTTTAAQTVNMFTTSTAAQTVNIATGATTGASVTKALNIGTGAGASTFTNITMGSSNGGTFAINSPAATFSNATAMTLGAASPTITFGTGPTLATASGTVTLFNVGPTAINFGGATTGTSTSTGLVIGSTATGATSWTNIATAALTGAFTKNVNIGTGGTTGSTTTINIGSTVGSTTTINGITQLTSGSTKIGNTTLAQGGTVSITLPTLAGTLAVLGANTFTDTQTLVTGTTTVPPLRIPQSTQANLLTSPLANAIESSVEGFYATVSATPGRGLIRAPQIIINTANSASSGAGAAVSVFGKALSLEANKIYRFRAVYYPVLTYGSSSSTININFLFSNGSQYIKYNYLTHSAGPVSSAAAFGFSTVETAINVGGTILGPVSYAVTVEGTFASNATTGGTFNPQFNTSGTGSSTVMSAGTFLEIEKIGAYSAAAGTIIAGTWA